MSRDQQCWSTMLTKSPLWIVPPQWFVKKHIPTAATTSAITSWLLVIVGRARYPPSDIEGFHQPWPYGNMVSQVFSSLRHSTVLLAAGCGHQPFAEDVSMFLGSLWVPIAWDKTSWSRNHCKGCILLWRHSCEFVFGCQSATPGCFATPPTVKIYHKRAGGMTVEFVHVRISREPKKLSERFIFKRHWSHTVDGECPS